MSYTSLHNHTDYSNIRMLDSTNKVEKLIDRAVSLRLNGIAITDHESLSGHVKAIKYLKSLRDKAAARVEITPPDQEELYAAAVNAKDYIDKFKLILGNEIYLVRNKLDKSNYVKGEDRYHHFILLAKDEVGHEQLRQLSSRAWPRSYYQFVERVPTYYSDLEEIIGGNPGHVIGSTACLGGFLASKILELGANSANTEVIYAEMMQHIEWCKKIFGDDFYLEIQPSYSIEQVYVNKHLIEIGKHQNIKVIVTTDSHYLSKDDRAVHKAYLNAGEGDREVDAFYASTYLMSVEEMYEYFKNVMTEEDLFEILNNTNIVGDKCAAYDLFHNPIVPTIPAAQLPISLTEKDVKYFKDKCEAGGYEYCLKFANSPHEQDRILFSRIFDGMVKKYSITEVDNRADFYERIEMELLELWNISEKMGERLSAYLLTVSKIVDLIWTDGDSIVGPSRGSALGFFINYLLDITQISPLDKNFELPHWRFINASRVSLPDVDIDTQGNRRTRITKALKTFFGELNVVNVATFGTEKSKSAIQTACRGLGIDVDIASYLSSMVPSERGFLWSLHDCFYGNEEEGRKPIANFVKEMSGTYAEVWNVAQNIEGLISRRGIHAAGVVISNEDITKTNALMRAPKGQLTTQYELNDTEYMGGLKFDLLSVEALDKIRAELELLCEYGYIERCSNLKETYMSILDPENPDILQYHNPDIWKMAYEDKILSLFQMETPVGGAAMKDTKPTNIIELAGINSLMRLMSGGQGSEMPMSIYNRYKNDINAWYQEMRIFGLNEDEIEVMKDHLLTHYGVAESQESMMLMVMDKRISDFSVAEADKLRKAVAKKSAKDFDKMQEVFYKKGRENHASEKLLEYVWEVQIKRQKGYSFSQLHTYGYSVIALQEMNLAYRFPVIFWNTANLIVDSAGEEDEDEDEIITLSKENDDANDEDGDDLGDEDDAEVPSEVVKKKNKTVNYGKISSAIGKMQQRNVSVSLPNINQSKYTFTPDIENERIMYGIKGITRIGDDLVKTIIENRPYTSLHDFLKRVRVNKLQAVNLIKSGAFDELEGLEREAVMYKYLLTVVDAKKDCNLRNMQMLINQELIPEEYDYYRKLFNFNKYLKKFKSGLNYELDADAFRFFSENYNVDLLQQSGDKMVIDQKTWDKIYTKGMDPMRDFLKANKQMMLDKMNGNLVREIQDKYAKGSLSEWEMASLGFYYSGHELKDVNTTPYDIRDFFEQPEEPVVANVFYPKGQSNPVPIFETYRIVGTVIQKDKTKHLVTILTPTGVVNVKVWQAQFTKYDKQISQKMPNGKKKIMEKSWFSRGNKILITGFRRGDNFVPKIYARGKYEHPFELIKEVNNGELLTVNSRSDSE